MESNKNEHQSAFANMVEIIAIPFAIYVILVLNCGMSTFLQPYVPSSLMYIFFSVWFALTFGQRRFTRFNSTQLAFAFSFYFLVILSVYVNKNINNYYVNGFAYLLMIYIILIHYMQSRYYIFRKILVVVLSADYLFVAINTFFQLDKNPYLARQLSTSSTSKEAIFGAKMFYGIGSFSYFYALVPVILLLVFLLLSGSKRKILIIALVFFAINLMLVASFTISIIFTSLFVLLMSLRMYSKNYKIILFFLSPIFIIIIYSGVIPSFFDYLSKLDNISYVIAGRFSELADFFSNQTTSKSDLVMRFDLYSVSLNTFFNSILWGAFGFRAGEYDIIGGHSGWLDLLASYGLLSITIIIFFIREYMNSLRIVGEKLQIYVKTYWAYFLLVGIINPIFSANIFVMWFIYIPLCTSLINESSTNNVLNSNN